MTTPTYNDETKILSAQALRAYQYIIDHGERDQGGHVLCGITAQTDYDGYSMTLSDGETTLRLLFHNKIRIDTSGRRALLAFRKKLAALKELGERPR